jgi:sporulation protein YlmC with PRC-barrel domain
MQRNVKSLIGFTIGATDGELGKVDEFYFDDKSWTIRYLIVKTGGWLSGRKVLISPAALLEPDWENEIFPVNLTKSQIENSPDIDTEKPVSRQHEIELYSHYAWPYDVRLGTSFYGGMGMMGMTDSRMPIEDIVAAHQQQEHPTEGDPHLRSTSEVKGYSLHATDGDIGEVEDFIIDYTDWSIRFLIVDTGNWLSGKKVLVSPTWIKEIKWETSAVYVDIPVENVKNSPEYDPSQPVSDTYENDLFYYYGKSMIDHDNEK